MVLNCFCERKGAYIMQVNTVTINPNFIQITDPTDHTSLFCVCILKIWTASQIS
jgi:hypothetical protein